MSHAHNPNSTNINLGNILGSRASVAQSDRFRLQMRGSSVAAALTSPTEKCVYRNHLNNTSNSRSKKNDVSSSSTVQQQPINVPIVLTHRGGQQTGGTVWENTEYWERRKATKQANKRQRDRSHLGHNNNSVNAYSHNYSAHHSTSGLHKRPGTYPEAAYTARSQVPPLSLNLTQTVSPTFKPPLHKRGMPDRHLAGNHAIRNNASNAGREMYRDDYGESLKAVIGEQQHSINNDFKGQGSRGTGAQCNNILTRQQRAQWQTNSGKGVTSPTIRQASSLRAGAQARLGHDSGNTQKGSLSGAARRGNRQFSPSKFRGNTNKTSRVF